FSRNIIVNDTEVPEAKFDYKDEIDEGGYMIINGTVSTDNIGIVDYSWVIENPDGELDNRTGEVINVTFSKEGDHTVTLNATDFSGNMDSHDAVVRVRRVPKPDILVNEDEIVYSKDKIKEGDTIEILANITNQGDIEAFNVTVHFYFRKDINDDRLLWVPIGNFTFPGPIVPEETRLANANYTVRESGQIVVNASMPVDAHPSGNPQVDEDPINNEGFQDIYVEPDENEPDWFLWGAVSIVIIIFVVVTVIFFKKPELMGIKPAKKLKKTKSRKKKKT
ncbi:MAG: PKD domain-containing protein, partial [Thermoplasmata archaeon]|nr:PKD domain-containing protein [Thermoplasmata archaeon]